MIIITVKTRDICAIFSDNRKILLVINHTNPPTPPRLIYLLSHSFLLQEVRKLEGRLEKVSTLVSWVNQEEGLFKFQLSSFPLLSELKVR